MLASRTTLVTILALFATASAYPTRRAAFTKQNGEDAIALNAKFKTLTAGSPCTAGETACIGDDLAQCVSGAFITMPCAAGTVCRALPLVNSAGTSVTCDTAADAEARIAITGATGTGAPAAAPSPPAPAVAPAAAPPPPDATPSTTAPTSSGTPVAPAACANKKRAFTIPFKAKRIAQADLPALAQSWHDLCTASGGDLTGDPCSTLGGINGINALLANADPCAQQVNADAMVTFAKGAGITNKDALIANAQAYAVHPRNALELVGGLIPSTPFCQEAPKNLELDGLSHKQLDGVNPGLFGGPKFDVVAFGDPASCPFGQTPDVDTCTCS